MSDARREYVAWGWAVNGFSSVVGAVLALTDLTERGELERRRRRLLDLTSPLVGEWIE